VLRVWGFHDGHACGYYRVTLPFDALAANGVDAGTSCGWADQAEDYPIIVGQRVSKVEALPIWRRLRARHRLVYEIDDDVWTIDPTNISAYSAHGLPVQDAAEMAIRVAHMVTVSTEPLAEVVRRHHDNVVVLPNHIDGNLLDLERPRRDGVVVGWAGGDSHLRDLAMLAPPLTRFLRRNPHVEWHSIGTDFRGLLRIPGRHTDWCANIWDYYRTLDFDVGVAPLIDSVFNSSKSAIKAIEYAALGIPVVASDVEPYRPVVLDGVTGFLVRREHEWGKRLYELANDEAMRTAMGAKAKEHAATMTIQNGWHLWEQAYHQLDTQTPGA
jgi:glycosyltransferase involved in cell wall biosynthesis